jgi:hypothetical protein
MVIKLLPGAPEVLKDSVVANTWKPGRLEPKHFFGSKLKTFDFDNKPELMDLIEDRVL